MTTKPLSSPGQIRTAYASHDTAAGYIGRRFVNELQGLLHERQVAAVQRVMRDVRPARTLEVAPGPGRVTRDVTPAGLLVCVEYNEGMIGQGRPAAGRAAWVRGDGFQLPFGDGFDFVYSFRFIRHFRADDRRRLYAEVRRVLRPGGHLVFDAVNERVARPLREVYPAAYPIYDKLYRPEELRDELTAAGFETVSLEPVQRRYRLQYRCQVGLGPRANWLNRLVIRVLERLARGDGMEWVVTCRRG
jgi:SAM-dependent methyltransferase